MTKVFSIISGKGGTGKSTVCANLAKAFAKMGKKVLAVDLDIGLRSLDLLLCLESKIVFDLGDVIAKKCTPNDAVVSHDEMKNLYLICGPRTLSKEFSVSVLLSSVRELIEKGGYDIVLVDLPAGLGFGVLAAKQLCDCCIAVTLPEAVAVRDTSSLVRTVAGFQKPVVLILNRVSEPMLVQSGFFDLDEVIDRIGAPLIGVLPEDPWINADSAGKNKANKKNRSCSDIFEAISGRLIGRDIPLLFREIK